MKHHDAREEFRFGGFTLDRTRAELRDAQGRLVRLRPKTFDLLLYLATRAGEVASHDEILDAVWTGVTVQPESVGQAVAELGVRYVVTGSARTAGDRFRINLRQTGQSRQRPPCRAWNRVGSELASASLRAARPKRARARARSRAVPA